MEFNIGKEHAEKYDLCKYRGRWNQNYCVYKQKNKSNELFADFTVFVWTEIAYTQRKNNNWLYIDLNNIRAIWWQKWKRREKKYGK